ncbi:hypothetical protein [Alicyclobacillus shizuokensis]|uniref:hypothetical protein n=1 Tax=Alicyclobacillus shizuokensis TaxID=392014 RepID=UPI001FE0E650|nr:hypothetical protein [Alicyclobacillus shizuokensis]
MEDLVSAAQVQVHFDEFIESVVRGKPQAVKRDGDVIVAVSVEQMRELLTAYPLNYEYEVDEDGRYAGSICEIQFIVADGATVEELRFNLANQLIEYAEDYMIDHSRYLNSPNTRSHFPYVLRVLLEDDIEAVASTLRSVAEDSGETGSSGNRSLGCVVDYIEKHKTRHFGKVVKDNNAILKAQKDKN